MEAGNKKKVLTVGLACLDIVNVVDDYPTEDSEVRLEDHQSWVRGGNASNSAVVLTQLGTPTAYLGTLAKHKLSELIVEDLNKYGVTTELCQYHDNAITPASCVILNTTTGSRTILHANKTLPEPTVEDFMKVNLDDYSWVHFEGRNDDQVLQMIEKVEVYNEDQHAKSSNDSNEKKRVTVSLEVEVPRRKDYLIQLLQKGDVVFVSKDVAKDQGYDSAGAAVKGFYSQFESKSNILICPWGEKGASAIGPDGEVVRSPAFPPAKVVDTLGAGDTFNAAVIHSFIKGDCLEEAVTFGCKIAGEKCGQYGLHFSKK